MLQRHYHVEGLRSKDDLETNHDGGANHIQSDQHKCPQHSHIPNVPSGLSGLEPRNGT
jgi:hypothetical protein